MPLRGQNEHCTGTGPGPSLLKSALYHKGLLGQAILPFQISISLACLKLLPNASSKAHFTGGEATLLFVAVTADFSSISLVCFIDGSGYITISKDNLSWSMQGGPAAFYTWNQVPGNLRKSFGSLGTHLIIPKCKGILQ